jgi:hypothetical protein
LTDTVVGFIAYNAMVWIPLRSYYEAQINKIVMTVSGVDISGLSETAKNQNQFHHLPEVVVKWMCSAHSSQTSAKVGWYGAFY